MKEIPKHLENKYFFHFTHIENLESILKNGLLSTNKKDELGLGHKNIANKSIQHRRSEMDVTCSPFKKVHDYVPFYFTTTNPMLLSLVNNKNIDQPFIVFFAIPIQKILEDNVVFTNASANTSSPPNFYNNPSELNELDWNAIDKTKWASSSDDERHKRMAEVLVYDEVPLNWIESIVVWNKTFKKSVIKTFKSANIECPSVTYEPFNGKFFYFCKFFFRDRKNETLVTGPYFLKDEFENAIKEIIKNQKTQTDFKFESIKDGINEIKDDFCCIDELKGIYELETANAVHSENVSDHTIRVVKNLKNNEYYSNLSKKDRIIVMLSAYLHDIGKGPKSKWKNGKQNVYPDHPADAIPMLERILTEDFKKLSKYQIRKICLLVSYHDLIGDILEKNRSKQELIDLINDENELNMLIAISLADISAINAIWTITIKPKLPSFIKEIKEEIERR